MSARKLTRRSESTVAGRIVKRDDKAALLEEQRLEEVRSRPVSSLKLEGLDEYAAIRVRGALERRGVATLGNVQLMRERDLRLTKNLGEKALAIIKAEMASLGVPLGGSVKVVAAEPGTAEFERLVSMPIDMLKLPGLNPGRANMAKRIWSENGIRTVGDLVGREQSGLRLRDRNRSYGVGRGAMNALERELSGLGLRTCMQNEIDVHKRIRTLALDVEDIEFSVRTMNAFHTADIRHLFDLVQKTEFDLLRIKYFGRSNLKEVKVVLADIGFCLGMKLEEQIVEKAGKLAEAHSSPAKAAAEPYIRRTESGQLETNLSREQLETLVRLANKELAELREDLQPHRIKVLSDFIELFSEK
jgi:hypothetical protein